MSKFLNSNLLKLIKSFNGRPHHLTQYLLENDALSENFLKKINLSTKLENLKVDDKSTFPQFSKIEDMKDYYNSFVNDNDLTMKKKSKEELEAELTQKIKLAIELENYEEAAKIRDWMKKNNLKKR